MSLTPLSPSLQESAPLAHILCLAGQEWPLTAGLKFRENTVRVEVARAVHDFQ